MLLVESFLLMLPLIAFNHVSTISIFKKIKKQNMQSNVSFDFNFLPKGVKLLHVSKLQTNFCLNKESFFFVKKSKLKKLA